MDKSGLKKLVIASRESPLAMWQARFVRDAALKALDGIEVEIRGFSTQGDKILDKPLAAIGGKGLFVKELERALLDGVADLAVHSMKDVPMELPEGFALAATPSRSDPRDAFVSPRCSSFWRLPQGARVGTSSLRREAQLRRLRPDLRVESLRGNLQTRLRKLDEGRFDAVVLASAGLERMGLADRIVERLPTSLFLPSAGQAALAIEVLSARTEVVAALTALNDPRTERQTRAERAFCRFFGGSCRLPIAAHAQTLENGDLRLRGFISMPDGSQWLEAGLDGEASKPEELALRLAQSMGGDGALAFARRVEAAAEARQ